MRTIALAGWVLCATIACRTNTVPDLTPYAGNYVLRTVNDTPLPYRVHAVADTTIDIVADTIFMSASGSFIDATHYRDSASTVVMLTSNSLSGNWTVSGSTVTFDAVSGDLFTGALTGATITIVGGGARAVYSK